MNLSRFILPIITLVLGLALGFLGNKLLLPLTTFPQEASPEPKTKAVTEEALPISLEFLQNPIFDEWRGGVEGTVMAKDEHVFVVQDEQGNQITITDLTSTGDVFSTVFYKPQPTGRDFGEFSLSGPEELSLDEIPIGTKVRGDAWFFKGGEDRPVGGLFQIIE